MIYDNDTHAPATYLNTLIKLGTVLVTLPAIGAVAVRPADSSVDKYILCRPKLIGGQLGATSITLPQPRTPVAYTVINDTDKGILLSLISLGKLGLHFDDLSFIHGFSWDVPQRKLLCHLSLVQELTDIFGLKLKPAPNGATEDTYAGDYMLCDKSGPMVFNGRLQITVKGSLLAYTLYSAVSDKITTVARTYLLDGLSNKLVYDQTTDKYLKAASYKLGLGTPLQVLLKPILISDDDLNSAIASYIDTPAYGRFREQSFKGGCVKGSITSVFDFQALKPYLSIVYSSDINNYNGTRNLFSVNGFMSVKSYNIPSMQLISQDFVLSLLLAIDALLLKTIPVADKALDKALQLDNLFNNLSQEDIITSTWTKQLLKDALEDLLSPFTQTLNDISDWQTLNNLIGQTLPVTLHAETKNTYDNNSKTVYKSTSFITQLPDGSIIIKDGYGSSIIMSRGNIYISSALDTFIRPGRDLISLVPHRVLTTADDLVVIASKKDVKVAALQSTYITSAVSGNQGYTVIENKAVELADDSGVILRSNGNMSITASKDMRIGLNDKRTKNAKEGITEGEGSIIISANQLSLGSKQAMNIMSGGALGLYAYQGSTGAGINIGTNSITIVGLAVMLDTGYTAVAHTSTKHEITSSDGKTKITLNSGSGDSLLHVRGELQSQGAVFRLSVQIGGQLGAGNYFIWRKNQLLNIPGVSTLSIKSFHNSLTDIFGFNITSLPPTDVSVNQSWYNDSYICDKLLSFKDSLFSGYVMPTMCWQILPVLKNYLIFKPVSATVTGESLNITYTYPGKQAWLSGHMTSIDTNTYEVKDNLITLNGGYKTNTKKED